MEGRALYDSVNAGTARSFYLIGCGLGPNLWFFLRENHSVLAICTASRKHEYTRQERFWVFWIAFMLGVLPTIFSEELLWKVMAKEDTGSGGRQFTWILGQLLIQAVMLGSFAGLKKLVKAGSRAYCARCGLVPTFFIVLVMFLGAIFDGGVMVCGSVWSTYEPGTAGTAQQFYGETGLDVSLSECQSYCGDNCGGVMHYQASPAAVDSQVRQSGCKLCRQAVRRNTSTASAYTYEPKCNSNELVNPGCPTTAFVLYSRVDGHSLLDDSPRNLSGGDFVERGQWQCSQLCPLQPAGWPRFRDLLVSLFVTCVIQLLKPAAMMARPSKLALPPAALRLGIAPPSLSAQIEHAEELATQKGISGALPTQGMVGLVDWPTLQTGVHGSATSPVKSLPGRNQSRAPLRKRGNTRSIVTPLVP